MGVSTNINAKYPKYIKELSQCRSQESAIEFVELRDLPADLGEKYNSAGWKSSMPGNSAMPLIQVFQPLAYTFNKGLKEAIKGGLSRAR